MWLRTFKQGIYIRFWGNGFVPCREVVPISEGPLTEVPQYIPDTALSKQLRMSRMWFTYIRFLAFSRDLNEKAYLP